MFARHASAYLCRQISLNLGSLLLLAYVILIRASEIETGGPEMHTLEHRCRITWQVLHAMEGYLTA